LRCVLTSVLKINEDKMMTWAMRKVDIRRLEAFEMWTGRRMEKIGWSVNGKVMEWIGEERALILIRTVRKRQWKGKNGGEADKWKSKTNYAGLDDDQSIQKAQRIGHQ